jgi:hypothetical protein
VVSVSAKLSSSTKPFWPGALAGARMIHHMQIYQKHATKSTTQPVMNNAILVGENAPHIT